MGRMGVKTPKKHPPVSNITQCVNSKIRRGVNSNSKYDSNFNRNFEDHYSWISISKNIFI